MALHFYLVTIKESFTRGIISIFILKLVTRKIINLCMCSPVLINCVIFKFIWFIWAESNFLFNFISVLNVGELKFTCNH